MSKVLAPIFVAIAMLGILSVVFGPSSKTRRESHGQRAFNAGFDSGVISALMVLKDKVTADPYELNARAAAWWNAQGGGGWQHTANATFTEFENLIVRAPASKPGVTNFSGPPVPNGEATNSAVVKYSSGKNVDYTDLVNVLVTDGTFCKVRGHSWGAHAHVTLEHVPSRVGCRKCQVCGLHQEQYASEWR